MWIILSGSVSLEAIIDDVSVPLKLLKAGVVINYYKLRGIRPSVNLCSARALEFCTTAFISLELCNSHFYKIGKSS